MCLGRTWPTGTLHVVSGSTGVCVQHIVKTDDGNGDLELPTCWLSSFRLPRLTWSGGATGSLSGEVSWLTWLHQPQSLLSDQSGTITGPVATQSSRSSTREGSVHLIGPLLAARTPLVVQMAKNLLAMREDPGSIPVLGRSPGEGNENPLQDSDLENPMDRGTWWATVCGTAKSQTRLSD